MPKIGKGGGEGESGPKEPFCFCTNFAFPTEDKLKSNLSTKFIGTVELSVFFSLSIPIPTLLRISADASGDGDSDGDSDGSLLGCRALDDAANKTLRLSSSPQPWLELEVRPPKVRCPPHFGNQDTVSTFVVTPQADGNITRAELLLKVIPIHLTRTDGRQFQLMRGCFYYAAKDIKAGEAFAKYLEMFRRRLMPLVAAEVAALFALIGKGNVGQQSSFFFRQCEGPGITMMVKLRLANHRYPWKGGRGGSP